MILIIFWPRKHWGSGNRERANHQSAYRDPSPRYRRRYSPEPSDFDRGRVWLRKVSSEASWLRGWSHYGGRCNRYKRLPLRPFFEKAHAPLRPFGFRLQGRSAEGSADLDRGRGEVHLKPEWFFLPCE